MARFSDEAVKAALCAPQKPARYMLPGAAKVEVNVRALTDAEMDGVRQRAADIAAKKKIEVVIDPLFIERLIEREIIAAAFFDPDAKEPVYFFGSQAEVAQLDNHTVKSFYELYVMHTKNIDPYAHASLEEVEELVEQLGKSENSVVILSLLDTDTLRSSLLSLALKHRETLQLLSSATG